MTDSMNSNRGGMASCPNVKALIEKVGIERTADLLGVAQSTVSKYRLKDLAPTAAEKAATYELEKRSGSRSLVPQVTKELIILRVDSNMVELLTTFLKGMGVRYMRFKD